MYFTEKGVVMYLESVPDRCHLILNSVSLVQPVSIDFYLGWNLLKNKMSNREFLICNHLYV